MNDLAPRVIAVQEDLVTIEIPDARGASLMKNELIYICPRPREGEEPARLKAEVLSIRGRVGVAQVFENTHGVGPGDPIEQTGQLLSVKLGPGLLGTVYDGLQNPLELFASNFGLFLPRGKGKLPFAGPVSLDLSARRTHRRPCSSRRAAGHGDGGHLRAQGHGSLRSCRGSDGQLDSAGTGYHRRARRPVVGTGERGRAGQACSELARCGDRSPTPFWRPARASVFIRMNR